LHVKYFWLKIYNAYIMVKNKSEKVPTSGSEKGRTFSNLFYFKFIFDLLAQLAR